MYTYKLHLHKEREGGYTVSVRALPGHITYGEDVDEAVKMAKEAIEWYMEELTERGEYKILNEACNDKNSFD